MTASVRPEEIVVAVRAVLEAASPALPTAMAFDARIAARLLELLQREMEHGAALRAREQEGLQALLSDAVRSNPLEALRARLCEEIESGRFSLNDERLVAHLWWTATDQLSIDNPAYRWRGAKVGE